MLGLWLPFLPVGIVGALFDIADSHICLQEYLSVEVGLCRTLRLRKDTLIMKVLGGLVRSSLKPRAVRDEDLSCGWR